MEEETPADRLTGGIRDENQAEAEQSGEHASEKRNMREGGRGREGRVCKEAKGGG